MLQCKNTFNISILDKLHTRIYKYCYHYNKSTYILYYRSNLIADMLVSSICSSHLHFQSYRLFSEDIRHSFQWHRFVFLYIQIQKFSSYDSIWMAKFQQSVAINYKCNQLIVYNEVEQPMPPQRFFKVFFKKCLRIETTSLPEMLSSPIPPPFLRCCQCIQMCILSEDRFPLETQWLYYNLPHILNVLLASSDVIITAMCCY